MKGNVSGQKFSWPLVLVADDLLFLEMAALSQISGINLGKEQWSKVQKIRNELQ